MFGDDEIKRPNYCQIAREAIQYYAPEDVDLQNLLAIIIGQHATPELCGKLASLGVRRLSTISKNELLEFPGIGDSAATRIMAAFGLAKKLAKSKPENPYTIRSPYDAAQYMMDELRFAQQEQCVVLFLNIKGQVIGKKTVFIGSLNVSIFHPREIFREALMRNSASIVCFHNHPSGDPTPSREDIQVTKRLHEVGNIMGIELLDHVVIGDGQYCRLKEKGYF
ncbi:RadC family protein [Microaerobacter geothermalis]|uniref:RadC family protein n=1 Tax=Microaerobacter geothermalis TaxID=674972 RepID=UPI0038B30C7F